MILLASFPGSGNTFLHEVLMEVYGLTVHAFHQEKSGYIGGSDVRGPFVPTHLLPDQLEIDHSKTKVIYLVRDGRDALLSLTEAAREAQELPSNFYIDLLEAIIAPGNTYHGGWTTHIEAWSEKADIIIRLEDLLKDPIQQIERLREIINLPQLDEDKLSFFESLPQPESLRNEMPEDLQELFWDIHEKTMITMGYESTRANREKKKRTTKAQKVILDATKLLDPSKDGIRRYVQELVNNLWLLEQKMPHKWKIDLLFGDKTIVSLKRFATQKQKIDEYYLQHDDAETTELKKELELAVELELPLLYEKRLLNFKAILQRELPHRVYRFFRAIYVALPFRYLLRVYKKMVKRYHGILFFFEKEGYPYDLFHIPLPQRVPEVPVLSKKLLVTFHDLTHKLFPEFHQKENIRKADWGMKEAIKQNADFISISTSSHDDLINQYKLAPNRSTVIFESASRDHFFPRNDDFAWEKILQKYQLTSTRFFLCLFTLEPRKNVLATIQAFQELKACYPGEEIALWICGKKGWKLEGLPSSGELSKNQIFFTGFIDEKDLPFFYSYAEALCYISHYEGFGLPPLEAMSCGTPIIYGNNSSMPEVVGQAGLPANSHDVHDIQKQMAKILLDKPMQSQLGEKALQRSLEFSWLKMAWQTLQVYQKTLHP